MSTNTTTRSGLSITTILFIVFLVLKLTNLIDWSWWWVTSPLWIPAIILIIIFGLGAGLIWLVRKITDTK